LTEGDQPEQVSSETATLNYFHLAGLVIARGRVFTGDEELPNGDRVVILSDRLWQRRFAGDPKLLGKAISLDGSQYRVIGILAPGSRTEQDPLPDVWLPLPIDPNSTSHVTSFLAAGRIRSGVTPDAARAQLQLAAEEFRRKFPAIGASNSFTIQPMRDAIVGGDVRSQLWIFLGAVGCVLLIACANVANLLLVRATARKREIAIRAAVGAGRGRIVRQLLAESVVLSLAGGALGLALGSLGIRALLAVSHGNIPRIGERGSAVSMNWRVLAFTVGVSLITGILFGLVPALQASRGDLNATLKDGGGRSGTGFRQNLVRSVLVIGEVTLALVLLIGADLFIGTFKALRGVDTGFDRHNVLTMRMSLTDPRFEKTSGIAELVREGIRRVRGLPGVQSAAASYYLPLIAGPSLPFIVVGRPLNGVSHGTGHWRTVSAEYFDVFKIPILRGRAFNDRDRAGTAGVAIVNQAMARRFWPQGDPLSAQIVIGKSLGRAFDDAPRQIVGIVGDLRDDGLENSPRPAMYIPLAQFPAGLAAVSSRSILMKWIVRTRVEPYSLSSAVKNELRQASGGLPVGSILSMDEIMAQSTASADFRMLLLSIFGGSALVLAAIGIYGLIAYTVQQRSQEIGIRLALGAESKDVRFMVVFQGMRLALIGIAIGIVAACALTWLIGRFLYGIHPLDPLTFTMMPLLLSAVALLSVWLPARRASRVDPVKALRCE
jgi:putative ABC transport system permease protein